jgi:hypothetical protein
MKFKVLPDQRNILVFALMVKGLGRITGRENDVSFGTTVPKGVG